MASSQQPWYMTPMTQIYYLNIPVDRSLQDPNSYHGRLWSSALDLIERSDGFHRLYWGRSLEKPENVQLHVVRQPKYEYAPLMRTKQKDELTALLQLLSTSGSKSAIQAIRYARLADLTPNSQALGRGAPFTGTAIYLKPTAAWNEGAWPLWTHIVRSIDGCLGCSGGPLSEPVELLEGPVLAENRYKPAELKRGEKWEGYLVYVGWESVEKHEAYHHTKHFAEHRVVLRCGNEGFAEYGHVVFEGSREKEGGVAKL